MKEATNIQTRNGVVSVPNTNVQWDGEAFKALIRKRGFETYEEVAAHMALFVPDGLGLTRQHIEHWASGRHAPSMKYIPAFRFGLGVTDMMVLFGPPKEVN